MKIAILGTRGIPNNYGGFEQFAEYLSLYLVKEGHEVYVYNSHTHPYQHAVWQGVNIIHRYDPEHKIGTAGQFVYDLNCILDIRKRRMDVVLQLGYTSSSVWGKLLPNSTIVVTNMDGLEWKRSKYSQLVQRFLKYAEQLAITYSDYLIADSVGIQQYLRQKYGVDSVFIPYGAHMFNTPSSEELRPYSLAPYGYNMLIARLEPENSVEIILDGAVEEGLTKEFIVVGGYSNEFGKYLKKKYATNEKIRFIGGVYNLNTLNNLRYYSSLYFHGHTVGGTNPSLLEAMASGALVCAHRNKFNQYILGEDAFYFTTAAEVAQHLGSAKKQLEQSKIDANYIKIRDYYTWENVNAQYSKYLQQCFAQGKKK